MLVNRCRRVLKVTSMHFVQDRTADLHPEWRLLAWIDFETILRICPHSGKPTQGCFAKSISTISELFRSRSNTICLPSAVISKVRMMAGFVRWVN